MGSVNAVTKENRDLCQMESDAESTWSSQMYDNSRGKECKSQFFKEAVEVVKLAGPAVSVNIKLLNV